MAERIKERERGAGWAEESYNLSWQPMNRYYMFSNVNFHILVLSFFLESSSMLKWILLKSWPEKGAFKKFCCMRIQIWKLAPFS